MIFYNLLNTTLKLTSLAINLSSNTMKVTNQMVKGVNTLLQGATSFASTISKLTDPVIKVTTQTVKNAIEHPILTTLVTGTVLASSYYVYVKTVDRITISQRVPPRPVLPPARPIYTAIERQNIPAPVNVMNIVMPLTTQPDTRKLTINDYHHVMYQTHDDPYCYLLWLRYDYYQHLNQGYSTITPVQHNILTNHANYATNHHAYVHLPTIFRVLHDLQPALLDMYRKTKYVTSDKSRLSPQELSYYKGIGLSSYIMTHLSNFDQFQGDGFDMPVYVDIIWSLFLAANGLPQPVMHLFEKFDEESRDDAYQLLIRDNQETNFQAFNTDYTYTFEHDPMAQYLFLLASVENGAGLLN
jgi:hypothetical protein